MGEMRKGAHYIARFESCAQLIGRLRPGVDAVQEAGATSGNEPPVTETRELSLHQVHADASSLPHEVDELSRQTTKGVDELSRPASDGRKDELLTMGGYPSMEQHTTEQEVSPAETFILPDASVIKGTSD